MSEFSESYHILGNDRNEAIQLLKRSGLRGFVFPELNGWVSLVANGPKFRPNKRLIKYNIGTLLHLIYAEDHGWGFAIYEGNKLTCQYNCWWEEDIEIDHENYHLREVLKLIDSNKCITNKPHPNQIIQILYPNDYDDFSKAGPAYDFCEIIGLQNIEWLSYKYVSEEWDAGNKSAYPNAIMVKPWYLFF